MSAPGIVVSASGRHLALLRQLWQTHRRDTGWNRAWVGPLVSGLGVAVLVSVLALAVAPMARRTGAGLAGLAVVVAGRWSV